MWLLGLALAHTEFSVLVTTVICMIHIIITVTWGQIIYVTKTPSLTMMMQKWRLAAFFLGLRIKVTGNKVKKASLNTYL